MNIMAAQINVNILYPVIGIALILIVLGAIIFYEIRRSIKVGRIKTGMTLPEAIKILGEPDMTETVDDITTAIWQTWPGRGGPRNYCTLVLKNGEVISKFEQGYFD